MDDLYTKFAVTIKFRDRIYGGLPKDPEIMKKYVEARLTSDTTFAEKLSKQVAKKSETEKSDEEKEKEVEEETKRMVTGFKQTDDGTYYIGDYVIKAHIKQSAGLMRLGLVKRGGGVKETIKECLFVKPEKHSLGKKLSGVETFVGHPKVMGKEMSIIKASEYMEKPKISFELWILSARMDKTVDFDENNLRDIFLFGQELGIGSNRSFEKGKYDLIELKKLNNIKKGKEAEAQIYTKS